MVSKVVCALFTMGLLIAGCGGDGDGGSSPAGGSGGSAGGAAGTAGTAGGQTGGSGAGTGTLCEQRCEATASLACPGDGSCAQDCQAAIDYAPWCSSIMESFVQCSATQLVENWVCGANGVSTLNSGTCQTEFEAGLKCLVDGPAGGMPDLSAACASTCAAMAGLDCAAANCEQTCNDSVANGPCAGAVGLVTVCGSALSSGDYECVNNTPVPSAGKCTDQVNLLLACLQNQ